MVKILLIFMGMLQKYYFKREVNSCKRLYARHHAGGRGLEGHSKLGTLEYKDTRKI